MINENKINGSRYLSILNKLSLVLYVAMFFCSCQGENKKEIKEKFRIQTHHYSVKDKIKTTTFHNGFFYCLSDKGELTCLTDEFSVDSVFTSKVNQFNLDNIFVHNDTLMAERKSHRGGFELIFLNNVNNWEVCSTEIQNWKRLIYERNKKLFEDDRFVVSGSCFGEFGGSVFFLDKSTKKTYSCPSTCPLTINKIGNEYYLTSTLTHLSGHTEVLKIKEPTKLYNLEIDSLIGVNNWWEILPADKDVSERRNQYLIGTEMILDTVGVLTSASFCYNNKLYLINTDSKETFISEIKGNSLARVNVIFESPLWSYSSNITKYKNFLLTFFINKKFSGFFVIKNDLISIIIFDHNVGKG